MSYGEHITLEPDFFQQNLCDIMSADLFLILTARLTSISIGKKDPIKIDPPKGHGDCIRSFSKWATYASYVIYKTIDGFKTKKIIGNNSNHDLRSHLDKDSVLYKWANDNLTTDYWGEATRNSNTVYRMHLAEINNIMIFYGLWSAIAPTRIAYETCRRYNFNYASHGKDTDMGKLIADEALFNKAMSVANGISAVANIGIGLFIASNPAGWVIGGILALGASIMSWIMSDDDEEKKQQEALRQRRLQAVPANESISTISIPMMKKTIAPIKPVGLDSYAGQGFERGLPNMGYTPTKTPKIASHIPQTPKPNNISRISIDEKLIHAIQNKTHLNQGAEAYMKDFHSKYGAPFNWNINIDKTGGINAIANTINKVTEGLSQLMQHVPIPKYYLELLYWFSIFSRQANFNIGFNSSEDLFKSYKKGQLLKLEKSYFEKKADENKKHASATHQKLLDSKQDVANRIVEAIVSSEGKKYEEYYIQLLINCKNLMEAFSGIESNVKQKKLHQRVLNFIEDRWQSLHLSSDEKYEKEYLEKLLTEGWAKLSIDSIMAHEETLKKQLEFYKAKESEAANFYNKFKTHKDKQTFPNSDEKEAETWAHKAQRNFSIIKDTIQQNIQWISHFRQKDYTNLQRFGHNPKHLYIIHDTLQASSSYKSMAQFNNIAREFHFVAKHAHENIDHLKSGNLWKTAESSKNAMIVKEDLKRMISFSDMAKKEPYNKWIHTYSIHDFQNPILETGIYNTQNETSFATAEATLTEYMKKLREFTALLIRGIEHYMYKQKTFNVELHASEFALDLKNNYDIIQLTAEYYRVTFAYSNMKPKAHITPEEIKRNLLMKQLKKQFDEDSTFWNRKVKDGEAVDDKGNQFPIPKNFKTINRMKSFLYHEATYIKPIHYLVPLYSQYAKVVAILSKYVASYKEVRLNFIKLNNFYKEAQEEIKLACEGKSRFGDPVGYEFEDDKNKKHYGLMESSSSYTNVDDKLKRTRIGNKVLTKVGQDGDYVYMEEDWQPDEMSAPDGSSF